MPFRVYSGYPFPLGTTVTSEGTNFSLFSRHGTAVTIELYASPNDRSPSHAFALDKIHNRTGDIWHIFLSGVAAGQLYGYRVDGPYTPETNGHRFNVHKLLADPYARAFSGHYARANDAVYGYDRNSPKEDLSLSELDSAPFVPKSVVVPLNQFDWLGDRRPQIPLERTVIYELHVRGFTQHPSSGVAFPGTYLGLVEKIPYFKELGVTTLELLPIHHFDTEESLFRPDHQGPPLTNYWGYATLGFFAPQATYAASRTPGDEINEFKEMVRQLHAAGIEVILDVVYNHTGEGGRLGPTYSFRGLDNAVYYALDSARDYRNESGCGNTVACNHPVVKQLILSSLRYWALEMHVDGFRFDLATILGRGPKGNWLGEMSLLSDILHDPILRHLKLIAEPWDAAGMYLVGQFAPGWVEWNDRFRDQLRRFVRGDEGHAADLARRIAGSADVFGEDRNALASVNYVTCHDGFTLRDLVSYGEKHNDANGEENRDGMNENWSANYGVEGDTADPDILALRSRQAKNLLTLLGLSRGIPMLLAGDELWRTQQGNNNAYCQDNALSWIDWRPSAIARELQRFVRLLLTFRRKHPSLTRTPHVDPFTHLMGKKQKTADVDFIWHGVQPDHADWAYHTRTLAVQMVRNPQRAPGTTARSGDILVILNAWTEAVTFTLPALRKSLAWHRVIDTAEEPPEDIVEEDVAALVEDTTYCAEAHSAIVLLAKRA